MNLFDDLRDGLTFGALAGLVGGLIFGIAMIQIDLLTEVASIIRAESNAVGFLLVMLFAAIIGAGFGALVWQQRSSAGELLFWGAAYGFLWWFLGPLTLQPLLLGNGLAWDVHAAQDAFPTLPGYIWYGAVTAMALLFFHSRIKLTRETKTRINPGTLLRGIFSGLFASSLLGVFLSSQGELMITSAMMTQDADSQQLAWFVTLLIGLLAGLGFALLYPRPPAGLGAGLIRGIVYGYFWWIAGALTILPLLGGKGLAWSLTATLDNFATLPGYLLFGAVLGFFYRWIGWVRRLLFSDYIPSANQEGPGALGLRALGRGVLAGIIGGLLFSVVMVQIGFLPAVASLVGSSSMITGFLVHLVIANIIGVTYAFLFRRHSFDISSALGWGLSYGFVWWILGPLTLMPILLGVGLQWTLDAATAAFPNLIGHLAYGSGLGITFYILEARYNPWWITRTQIQEERSVRHLEQLTTSAPALWTLTLMIALTIPILLGM